MNNTIYVNGRFLTQEMTGVQRVATEISLYLQEHYGKRLVFICPDKPKTNDYAHKFNCISTGSNTGYFWEQIELTKYLIKVKAQILLNFGNTAPIFFNKNIIVVHDMAIKPKEKWFDKKFVMAYNFLYYFNIKKALEIITVSNYSKNEILHYYPKTPSGKVSVAYLASFIHLNKADANTIKQDYFIAVNSLNGRKNIKAIIEAFKLLDPAVYKLKIVGGLNTKVFSEGISANESNIEFTGSVNDETLYHLLLNAKGFINSSWYEGFGLPPLEAMSVKTPCILSDIPVYRELYNKTALFFNPANPSELAKRIKELYNMEGYNNFCEKSYELSQTFSWSKTADNYVAIIDKYI